MEWFRSYHNAPKDPKWQMIAVRTQANANEQARATPGHVAAIWWSLMDYASQQQARGSINGFDIEELAIYWHWSVDLVENVIETLRQKGLITEDQRLAAWDKRQPKREDGSADRARQWREQLRTRPNAGERKRPLDTEKIKKEDSPQKPPRKRGSDEYSAEFNRFWEKYPEKAGKPPAWKAFRRAIEKTSVDTIIAGLDRYIAHKPPDRQWLLPATFLNGERWNDQHAPVSAPVSRGAFQQKGVSKPGAAPEPHEQRMASFRKSGFWAPLAGPKPGQRGCTVPDRLLTPDEINAKYGRGSSAA